jgi:hypothetical protein
MGGSGIGSSLNNVILATTLLLQEHPNNTVFLDASPGSAACDHGFRELLLPQQPGLWNNSVTADCKRMSTKDMFKYIQTYSGYPDGDWLKYVNQAGPGDGSGFFHQVSMPNMTAPEKARHSLIWDAMWHAMCPVIRRFWILSPAVRQRQEIFKQSLRSNSSAPVVAIHVRGGDKIAAGTREIPGWFDYTFVRGLEKVAEQLGKEPKTHAESNHQQQLQQRPVCLILGDDAQLMATVRDQAQQILNCSQLLHAAAAGSHVPWGSKQCDRVQTMLADTDTLAWADYTVGTMWSNFDAVAFYVAICSYGRQQATYVDGSRNPFGPYA